MRVHGFDQRFPKHSAQEIPRENRMNANRKGAREGGSITEAPDIYWLIFDFCSRVLHAHPNHLG